MEMEITLPEEVPVMTLPNVAFFPQALLPLHIFEQRYRQMLKEVLTTDRLFAVAGLNSQLAATSDRSEPPHRIASVGIIRACQKNANGTSNLLLQGLARIEVIEILSDEPYRRIRIRALASDPGGASDKNHRLRLELVRLLALKRKLASDSSVEMTEFLKSVDDPETFVDIAAFNLCDSPKIKQKLLETLDVHSRLHLFIRQLQSEIESIKLRRKLESGLSDDTISNN
jgi:ATP-dependent Lon protease